MTDAAFQRAVAFVIDQLEGGGREVTDSGGLTRWGISQRAYPQLDIHTLSRERAEALYARDYWAPLRAGEIPAPLALCLFDAGVNQGVHTATILLQEVLGVGTDGTIGPKTVAAARQSGPETIVRFLERRLHRYELIARTRPFHITYLAGWRSRVLRVAMEAALWGRR